MHYLSIYTSYTLHTSCKPTVSGKHGKSMTTVSVLYNLVKTYVCISYVYYVLWFSVISPPGVPATQNGPGKDTPDGNSLLALPCV